MRNRKFVGLVFAVAMAWQGLFIAMMSTLFRDYYFEEIFFFRDELEGSTGYIFLTAMVVTSFNFGRRHLSSRQWKLIHRSGMYYLWAYPFAVYWWNLFYYADPVSLDYVLYWLGFLAVALRIVAWGKKRRLSAVKNGLTTGTPVAAKALGAIFVLAGPVAAATGLSWGAAASDWLTSTEWSATLELWLPFWPFEPFLPLIAMGLGTMLFTVTGSAPAAQATTN